MLILKRVRVLAPWQQQRAQVEQVAASSLWQLAAWQWGMLMLGGALINGLAGLLFFSGLQRCRAGSAAALTLLEPVTAMVIGWLVWSEPLYGWAVVGAAMVLMSLYLVLTQPQESSDQAEPLAGVEMRP